MRLFLILTYILFFEVRVSAQVQEKLDQYFLSENYALYISHFEDKYLSEDFDNINSTHVSNYIISLLKSNFNSSGIVPSRKLKNLKNHIENYILSNKTNTSDRLLYEYGKSEFNSDRFNSSVKYLEKITFKNDEIYFLLGVSEFNIKNYKKFKNYLELVDDQQYVEKKNFFLGVISYLENDLESALNYFNNISNTDLENKYLQYLVSINFINNDYKETISLKNRINENVDNIDYCLFFIGKAHFILEEYQNSIDVLTKLDSKVDREDEISFMIGYSHYRNGDFNLSKELFKSLSYKSSVYSQYASFYLGMIFLDENDFNLSKNYFYASFKQDNDANYTKKSLINYAKSIYELGDYELSIAVLNKYKKSYPDDDFSEIDELLSENYFMTNNYSRIISFINSKRI